MHALDNALDSERDAVVRETVLGYQPDHTRHHILKDPRGTTPTAPTQAIIPPRDTRGRSA